MVVLGVLVSLFVGGRWLGRLALVSAAVLVAGLSLGNVNGFVADRNIALYRETGEIDSFYLSQLGDDAVPTIHESDLPAEVKACVISRSSTQDGGSTARVEPRPLPRRRHPGGVLPSSRVHAEQQRPPLTGRGPRRSGRRERGAGHDAGGPPDASTTQ
nr:DUF4173 domain-containing protein [Janibacter limosus]